MITLDIKPKNQNKKDRQQSLDKNKNWLKSYKKNLLKYKTTSKKSISNQYLK